MKRVVEIDWSGHGCLDLTKLGRGKSPKPGELRIIDGTAITLGGSAFNKAVVATRLAPSMKHNCVAPIGDDGLALIVRDLLGQVHPNLPKKLVVIPGQQTSHTYVKISGGDRAFEHAPAANNFVTRELRNGLSPTTNAIVFGYPALMRGMMIQRGRMTKKLFEGHPYRPLISSGLTVLDMVGLDPNSEAGRLNWITWHRNVMPSVGFYAPSAEELLYMLDRPLFDELSSGGTNHKILAKINVNHLRKLARLVLEMGCRSVTIKMGPFGAYFASGKMPPVGLPHTKDVKWTNRELWIPAYQEARFVSSTGAGDAAIAAMVICMLTGTNPELSLASAIAAGSACVEQIGTDGVPELGALQQRMKSWPHLNREIKGLDRHGSYLMGSFASVWHGNLDGIGLARR